MNICSPFIPKYLSSPRSVCMDGIIYLVADNTKKVYSYDSEANMWQKVGIEIGIFVVDCDFFDSSYKTGLISLSSGAASSHAP